VERVRDRWRIDDEWWRERPIARLYYALLLEDGTFLTVYRDLAAGDLAPDDPDGQPAGDAPAADSRPTEGAWFEQREPATTLSS